MVLTKCPKYLQCKVYLRRTQLQGKPTSLTVYIYIKTTILQISAQLQLLRWSKVFSLKILNYKKGFNKFKSDFTVASVLLGEAEVYMQLSTLRIVDPVKGLLIY